MNFTRMWKLGSCKINQQISNILFTFEKCEEYDSILHTRVKIALFEYMDQASSAICILPFTQIRENTNWALALENVNTHSTGDTS